MGNVCERGGTSNSYLTSLLPLVLNAPVEELRRVNEEIAEGYHRLWGLWLDAIEAKRVAETDSKRWMRKLKDTQDEMFALKREMEQIRRKIDEPDIQLSIDFEAKLNTRRVSHEVATAGSPDPEEWEEGLEALRKEAALLRFSIQEIERGAFANASEFETPKDRKALLARTRSPLRRLHRLSDKENIQ